MCEEVMRKKVREVIIKMQKPFCIENLLIRLERQKINDLDVILSVLDEMFEEGLILYDEVDNLVNEPTGSYSKTWAFVVA